MTNTEIALRIINEGKPSQILTGSGKSLPIYQSRLGVVARMSDGAVALAITGNRTAAVQQIWNDPASAVQVQFDRRRPR